MDSQINYNCEGINGKRRWLSMGADVARFSLGNLAARNPSPQSWKLESDPTTDLNRASETERMSALGGAAKLLA
jgi:hypothetical protein